MRVIFILIMIFMVTPLADGHAAQVSKEKQNTLEYRKIYKLGYKGNYVITGEARQDSFFYTVDDGHIQYIRENKVSLSGDTQWHPFKIMVNIPQSALPHNGAVILTLYERNQMGIIHSFPIVLEQFYQ